MQTFIRPIVPDAEIAEICSKPIDQWSYDEFARAVIIIPVKEGRGKSGDAKTGALRYLIDDELDWHNHIGAIRAEGKRLYLSNNYDDRHRNGDPGVLGQDEWVGQFVTAVLCHHGNNASIVCARGDGSRPFVLVNVQSKAASLNIDIIIRTAAETYGMQPTRKAKMKP